MSRGKDTYRAGEERPAQARHRGTEHDCAQVLHGSSPCDRVRRYKGFESKKEFYYFIRRENITQHKSLLMSGSKQIWKHIQKTMKK